MLRCPFLVDLGFQEARGAHRSSALWGPGSEKALLIEGRAFPHAAVSCSEFIK